MDHTVATAIMRAMDRSIAWRAALLQGVLLAVIAVVLAVALPRSFFEDWGWLAGPGVWGVCALVVAAVLRLPFGVVVVGAALSGLLMLPGVFLDAHWLGAPVGLLAFGAWCGWLAGRRDVMAVA